MRLNFFAVYRENSFYGMHRPWMSEGSSVLWPGHENEIYRPPEVPLSVDADGITNFSWTVLKCWKLSTSTTHHLDYGYIRFSLTTLLL